MSILALVYAPDPRLKQISTPVPEVNDEIRKLLDDMLETMYYSEGAGLAAIQVGIPKRILVLDVGKKDNENTRNPIFMVNPEIVTFSDNKCIKREGCLSLPDQAIELERSETIIVKYLDYNGEAQQIEADSWLARAVQHEMDHLNGILLVDHVPPVKRDMMIRKANKIKKAVLPK